MPFRTAVRAFSAQVFFLAERSGWLRAWAAGTLRMAEYEQPATQFNTAKFDTEAWAPLAEHAGMKYLVVTSKQVPSLLTQRHVVPIHMGRNR
jgi:hypothetical protein